MKTVICEKFGGPDVLQIKEKEKPVPKDTEILIENYASSINTVDIMYRSAKLPPALFWSLRTVMGPIARLGMGIRKPKMRYPGEDFAGKIVAIGANVTKWKEGEKIYGYSDSGGSLAEYLCLPEDYSKMTKMPSNLSFQEAGTVPGGAPPALNGLKNLGNLQPNHKVLIIGASGGIGTFAVQIAKILQAEVTAVCGPNNVEMVKKIGADYVIDYTVEDYIKNTTKYDIIFDVVAKISFSEAKKLLTEKGLYVSNNPMNKKSHLFHIIIGNNRFKQGSTDENAENLSILRKWIEEGKLRPVIDSVFTLEQISEAHKLYETGHAKGRIAIEIKKV